MKCPKCKKKINDHERSCPFCGAQIEMVCIDKGCGRTLKAFMKYCPNCHAENPGYIDPLVPETPKSPDESPTETPYSSSQATY